MAKNGVIMSLEQVFGFKGNLFALPEELQDKESLLNRLPEDFLTKCLKMIDFNSLLALSVTSKMSYLGTSLPIFWENYATKYQLTMKSPPSREECFFNALIFKFLKLEKHLGPRLSHKIAELPLWRQEIKLDATLPQQFSLQTVSHHNCDLKREIPFGDLSLMAVHAYAKGIIDGDLCLILIPKNRWMARIVRFNRSFNSNSSKYEVLFWEYTFQGFKTTAGINATESRLEKRSEMEFYWSSLKATLYHIFEIKYTPVNEHENQMKAQLKLTDQHYFKTGDQTLAIN